ncbi:hypothetical protein N2W46_000246 [Clostridium perfringens]|uniref:hypothetical protein n=1 Tax=Clostridium perfringens TaxID=1502 RepID=UPI0022E5464E|nr:hypothetical protein [Clostridium perfringens]EJT5912999.1 hypothetical protein [Clostridium perfringens]EJT5934032.1 hypothetical protein [Clostridium perfringens]ELC8347521.1 hypothetical protein [Clostridium perfringens]MDK0630298.1 hypothetical protein [Clostridium perfringens]MDU2442869.1 hypothetical protein [Clostridium perfringens]
MGRQRVSKGAVIVKKKEKIASVFKVMGDRRDEKLFIETFRTMYPKDWERIEKKFNEHERLSKGKKHPMPNPYKYLQNTYRVYVKQEKQKEYENSK